MSELLRNGIFIDGQWLSGGPTYPVLDPASGELITQVQKAGAEQTELAIAAAERALPDWRALTAKERSQRLKRWSELMLVNQRELATLMCCEQGKPLAEAMGEVVYAASFLEWFAEEAKRAYGDVIPSHKADARIVVAKQAIGVVAAITPWNFPRQWSLARSVRHWRLAAPWSSSPRSKPRCRPSPWPYWPSRR